MSRILEDVAAALRLIRARPEIDRSRVALWGTSLGASHVLATAARDDNLAAAVVQCPMIATVKAALGLGLAHLARLTGPITEDLVRRALRRNPRYVPLVGQPGELALVNKPGAHEGWYSLVPPGATFDNRANAAAALGFLRYRVDAHVSRIACPLLVCVSDRENLMEPEIAVRAAQTPRAGKLSATTAITGRSTVRRSSVKSPCVSAGGLGTVAERTVTAGAASSSRGADNQNEELKS